MSAIPPHPIPDTPFVNEVRLNLRQWLVVLLITGAVLLLTPWVWTMIERFQTGPDYRIPYRLSQDYWLYSRRCSQVRDPARVFVVGDSVVWGEYVSPDGTLPHFLSREAGEPGKFANAGVNGLFPLALEGLVDDYGEPMHNRKVLLHCNLLWMSSPRADLSTQKEQQFNHAHLVPQFDPWIPCYKADMTERLGIAVERHVPFLAWVRHLQCAYFDQKNILAWTLATDGGDPPSYPNVYKNPLAQITLEVPGAPSNDPMRGPASPRHKPWSTTGEGRTRFDWVALDSSLQWGAFQRLVECLQARDNELFVVIGPFNEHIMAEENLPAFERLRDGIDQWLTEQHVPHAVPEPLPSPLYADASHPLTQGYELLAQRLYQNPNFIAWLGPPVSSAPARASRVEN